jgi:dipeptidyl aminopeptidase/acylaminoacyl peptidase
MRHVPWLLLFAGLACLRGVGYGQDRSVVDALTIEDVVGAPFFQGHGRLAALSPDGTIVAYTACNPRLVAVATVADASYSAKSGAPLYSRGCDIWLVPSDGGPARMLPNNIGSSWAPSWSPDGQWLAYISDRGGVPKPWVWNRQKNERSQVGNVRTSARYAFEVPAWIDSRRVVLKLREQREQDARFNGTATTVATPSTAATTVRVYRSPAHNQAPSDATGRAGPVVDPALAAAGDIGVVDVATGAVRRLVHGTLTRALYLSPDARYIAYLTYEKTHVNWNWGTNNLVVLELATGAERVLVRGIEQHLFAHVSWSPDSRYLAYHDKANGAMRCAVVKVANGQIIHFSRPLDGGESVGFPIVIPPRWSPDSRVVYTTGNAKIWRANIETGRLESLTRNLGPVSVELVGRGADGANVWSPDGGESIVARVRDTASGRSRFDRVLIATGDVTTLYETQAQLTNHPSWESSVVSEDGETLVYMSSDAKNSPDLWTTNARFSGLCRLTRIAPRLGEYKLGVARLIDFRSYDGAALRAALLLPSDFAPGRRYPMIVWVYPGEIGSREVNTFGLASSRNYNMQLLATRGYAVLRPDIPVHRGTTMQDLMKATMPAIDRVIELGIADPDRLAVMGQSAGGYATLAIVTQTQRFKAAVMNAGYGDLTAMHGDMIRETGQGRWVSVIEGEGQMGAPPWQVPHLYVQNSPIYYLDRISTPLMIQAGEADVGIVPYSRQVFLELHRLGKDVTYIEYAGERHTLERYGNLVDYWRRVLEFFEQHLRPKTSAIHRRQRQSFSKLGRCRTLDYCGTLGASRRSISNTTRPKRHGLLRCMSTTSYPILRRSTQR